MAEISAIAAIVQLIRLIQAQVETVEGNKERSRLLAQRCGMFIEPLLVLQNDTTTFNEDFLKLISNLKNAIFRCTEFIDKYCGPSWKKVFNQYFSSNIIQETFESLNEDLSNAASDLNLGITIKSHQFTVENQIALHEDSVKIIDFLKELQEINNIRYVDNHTLQKKIIDSQTRQEERLQTLINLIVTNLNSKHSDIVSNSRQLFTLAQDYSNDNSSSFIESQDDVATTPVLVSRSNSSTTPASSSALAATPRVSFQLVRPGSLMLPKAFNSAIVQLADSPKSLQSLLSPKSSRFNFNLLSAKSIVSGSNHETPRRLLPASAQELDYDALLQKSVIDWDFLDFRENISTVIGDGSFGTVYKCKYQNKNVALKKFKNFNVRFNVAHEMLNLRREALIMQACQHINVLHYIGVDLDRGILLTELAYSSLFNIIHRSGDSQQSEVSTSDSATESESASAASRWTLPSSTPDKLTPVDNNLKTIWTYQILCGLRFLHFHSVIHRDLNLSNILIVYDLVSDSYVAKIADFGVSTAVGMTSKELTQSAVGTIVYMAPELFDDELPVTQVYSLYLDIYAVGIAINEMFTGEIPWKGLKEAQIIKKVFISAKRPPLFIASNPAERVISNIIGSEKSGCLHQDLAQRPTTSKLCKMLFDEVPFLKVAAEEAVTMCARLKAEEVEVHQSNSQVARRRSSMLSRDVISTIQSIERMEADHDMKGLADIANSNILIPVIAENVCIAVGNACVDHSKSEYRTAFGQAGGCKGLAKLFSPETPTCTSRVQEHLCWAIQHVCYGNDFNAKEMGTEGVCESLAALLRAETTLAGVAEQACLTVCILCLQVEDSENKERFGAAGGCEGLARLIKKPVTPAIIENSCIAVAAVCMQYDVNKTRFGESGGCQDLARLITAYVVAELAGKACEAIRRSCEDHPENQTRFGEAGGCESLLRLLTDHYSSGESSVTQLCAEAIIALARKHRANKTRLQQAGALELLTTVETYYAKSNEATLMVQEAWKELQLNDSTVTVTADPANTSLRPPSMSMSMSKSKQETVTHSSSSDDGRPAGTSPANRPLHPKSTQQQQADDDCCTLC